MRKLISNIKYTSILILEYILKVLLMNLNYECRWENTSRFKIKRTIVKMKTFNI